MKHKSKVAVWLVSQFRRRYFVARSEMHRELAATEIGTMKALPLFDTAVENIQMLTFVVVLL
jgi:hypothetical protein